MAFFATMPIYSPNIVPLFSALSDSGLTGAFVWSFMVAVTLSSLVLAVLSRILPANMRMPRVSACAVVAYSFVTACFYLMLLGFLPYSMMAARVLGVLSGVLFVPCAVVVARTLSPCTLEGAIIAVCVAAGASSLLNWFSMYLPAFPLAVLYSLLLGIIVVSFFVEGRRCEPGDTLAAEPCLPLRESLARFMSVIAPALIGLSVVAFFMGVSRPNITENASADVVGVLLAAVSLAPLCLLARRLRHPLQTFFHQLLLPLLAVAVLAVFAVFEPVDDSSVRAFLPVSMYYFFGAVALFTVAFAIAGSSAREFPPLLVLSAIAGCFSLSSMAGIAFGGFFRLPEGQSAFMPVVVVAMYCVFLVASSIATFWCSTSSRSEGGDAEGASDGAPSVSARCESLSAGFGLSPRECEILDYLARGHTASFIAKTLIISESTVYTHTRNIYQKMGISSREELLALIETED